jgi:glyoxylase-like metal-dependent hydrolase (beta-lactamase superfamily II)
MATAPTSATIRTYHVGFGDCFLISFEYRRKSERHVLIDFGSTGVPKGVPKSRMMDIAANIKQRTGGKLHAVVATHRHRDHISGFATGKAGQATGAVIKSLKPDLIVQPWTEDPKLGPEATGPSGSNANNKKFGAGTSKQVAALSLMHEVAGSR